ncbi:MULTISPECIES: hypothetical protein [unclassified Flavobacterium]|uniref:hypothetical protein n=1 Tax=unclassified Flavobacterium TaxID=196869 RepID=UPI001F12F7E8|nr:MULTISPECIES: hypothetical protein [unclassified Flavobacterium]UMY64918.1 hypothetical protein MKO97_10375 [Flavobacterium sp. HJ-32-4]
MKLRSEKQYFDVDYEVKYEEPNSTIDVIFTAVDFISIPHRFSAIEIQKIGDTYIFNNNNDGYVKAASCTVGKYVGDDEDQIWGLK